MIELFETVDWLSMVTLALRWAHVMIAIAWIGTSFYFIWLDFSLKPPADGSKEESLIGESWSVHGGGFYRVAKFASTPRGLPKELHWFKWESWMTWISGFVLMILLYYIQGADRLVDSSVLDVKSGNAVLLSMASLGVAWGLYHLMCKSFLSRSPIVLSVSVFLLLVGAAFFYESFFLPRPASLHVGVVIGTLMTGNVFFVIIPNQKKTVARLLRHEKPDPRWGLEAKMRSSHNNYLTLPVLVMMLAGHFPILNQDSGLWLSSALIILTGGLVRDFFNSRNQGKTGFRLWFQWPAATGLMVLLALWTAPPRLDGLETRVPDAEALAIVQQHCQSCHARSPTHPDFDAPPNAVVLETRANLVEWRLKIQQQAIAAQLMPPGNPTNMTPLERQRLGVWLAQLAGN